jgi:hypothetical protein
MTSEQASTILRELPPDKAFYFYREVNSPLNVSAGSLREFLARLMTVEPASLAYHCGRGDFETWVSMLGDDELAKKLAGMRGSRLKDESLRTRLYATTKSRVDQLTRLGVNSPKLG